MTEHGARAGQQAEQAGGDEVRAELEQLGDPEGALVRRLGAHPRRVGEWSGPGEDLLGFIVAEGRPRGRADDEPLPCKPPALDIEGSPAWRGWVERAAAHSRMGVSAYVDFATARTAKAEGFPEEPPERLP